MNRIYQYISHYYYFQLHSVMEQTNIYGYNNNLNSWASKIQPWIEGFLLGKNLLALQKEKNKTQ